MGQLYNPCGDTVDQTSTQRKGSKHRYAGRTKELKCYSRWGDKKNISMNISGFVEERVSVLLSLFDNYTELMGTPSLLKVSQVARATQLEILFHINEIKTF